MPRFVISDHKKCWLVNANDKHVAIGKAVENDFAESMSDFYYGLEDGQIEIKEVDSEI